MSEGRGGVQIFVSFIKKKIEGAFKKVKLIKYSLS